MGQLLVTYAVCVVGNALCQPICILNGASPSTATGMDGFEVHLIKAGIHYQTESNGVCYTDRAPC